MMSFIHPINKFVKDPKISKRAKKAFSLLGGYHPLLEFSHLKKSTLKTKEKFIYKRTRLHGILTNTKPQILTIGMVNYHENSFLIEGTCYDEQKLPLKSYREISKEGEVFFNKDYKETQREIFIDHDNYFVFEENGLWYKKKHVMSYKNDEYLLYSDLYDRNRFCFKYSINGFKASRSGLSSGIDFGTFESTDGSKYMGDIKVQKCALAKRNYIRFLGIYPQCKI